MVAYKRDEYALGRGRCRGGYQGRGERYRRQMGQVSRNRPPTAVGRIS